MAQKLGTVCWLPRCEPGVDGRIPLREHRGERAEDLQVRRRQGELPAALGREFRDLFRGLGTGRPRNAAQDEEHAVGAALVESRGTDGVLESALDGPCVRSGNGAESPAALVLGALID